MTAPLAHLAPRLSKCLLMLSSPEPGEVVAAARTIDRTLRGVGLDWHDLAATLSAALDAEHRRATHAPAGSELAMARALRNHPALSAWERQFVDGVLRRVRDGWPILSSERADLRRLYFEVSP